MMQFDSRRTLLLSVLALSLAASTACRKTETPPPPPSADAIRFGGQNEIASYKEILRKDPGNLQALIGIGNLYYDSGQDRLAIDAYKRALEIDPANTNVRVDMAICHRRIGDPDTAIGELKKAISLDPRHPQARYNLGVILIHDKKDVEGGVKAWEALLENVPGFPDRERLQADIDRLKASGGGAPRLK